MVDLGLAFPVSFGFVLDNTNGLVLIGAEFLLLEGAVFDDALAPRSLFEGIFDAGASTVGDIFEAPDGMLEAPKDASSFPFSFSSTSFLNSLTMS